jgi:23S rRNA (cytosine1962-C5)-methyltransferase
LSAKAAAAAKRGHPWIYTQPGDSTFTNLPVGQSIELLDTTGKTLGYGLNEAGEMIAARVYDRKAPVDPDYFHRRLRHCVDQRRPVRKITDAIRILHGENDGIPGVVLDQYNDYGVLKLYSAALLPWQDHISEAVRETELFTGVYCSFSRRLQQQDSVLYGDVPEKIRIIENGMRFDVDVRRGQKTGFFIDQRDGRALAGRLAEDMTVLNCFSYTGGFSVAAMLGGAKKVVSVDVSAGAVAAGIEHIELNCPSIADRHEAFSADVWEYLRGGGNRFDLIILDPPALTTDKQSLPQAQKAYRSLHTAALKRLQRGGTLLTCSCSARMTEPMFLELVTSTAEAANRKLKLVETLKQPPDHPTRKNFPEGQYLKVLLFNE